MAAAGARRSARAPRKEYRQPPPQEIAARAPSSSIVIPCFRFLLPLFVPVHMRAQPQVLYMRRAHALRRQLFAAWGMPNAHQRANRMPLRQVRNASQRHASSAMRESAGSVVLRVKAVAPMIPRCPCLVMRAKRRYALPCHGGSASSRRACSAVRRSARRYEGALPRQQRTYVM